MSGPSLSESIGGRELAPVLLVAGVAVLVAILYMSSFASLVELWQHNDHRHGALVFPISAFLLWRSRAALSHAPLQPWVWGVALLLVLVLVWGVSRAVGIQAAEHLAAILLIPAAVATFLGISLAGRALFPLLFLVAAVPFGEVLIPYLMSVTADVSAALLRAAGVPVFRQGQFMSLPGGDFEVAEVCSGLRYLISGTMIALLFAYITFSSNLKRVAFVATAVVSLVLANGVRAFVTMYVASATDLRYFTGRDHILFGWVLFAAVVIALFWGGIRFADGELHGRTDGPSTLRRQRRAHLLPLALVFGLVMLAITAQPFQQALAGKAWVLVVGAAALLIPVLFFRFRSGPATGPTKNGAAVTSAYLNLGAVTVIAAAAVLAAGPLWLAKPAADVADPRVRALPELSSCESEQAAYDGWKPAIESPDFVLAKTYRCSGQPVSVFVAGYMNNIQGKELATGPSRVLSPEWRAFAVDAEAAFALNGREVEVNEVRVSGGRDSLVWYWYGVGDATATTSFGVKLMQAYQFVAHGRSDGRLYLMVTPSADSGEAARKRLAAAAAGVVAAIESGSGELVSRRDRS
jgi:exosortase A